jgi:hypothetical protein
MDTDAAQRELVDERAIARLMVDYFDAVDALDPYRAVEIFTDDVEGDFMTGRLYHGRPAIARALGKILLQSSPPHDSTNRLSFYHCAATAARPRRSRLDHQRRCRSGSMACASTRRSGVDGPFGKPYDWLVIELTAAVRAWHRTRGGS